MPSVAAMQPQPKGRGSAASIALRPDAIATPAAPSATAAARRGQHDARPERAGVTTSWADYEMITNTEYQSIELADGGGGGGSGEAVAASTSALSSPSSSQSGGGGGGGGVYGWVGLDIPDDSQAAPPTTLSASPDQSGPSSSFESSQYGFVGDWADTGEELYDTAPAAQPKSNNPEDTTAWANAIQLMSTIDYDDDEVDV